MTRPKGASLFLPHKAMLQGHNGGLPRGHTWSPAHGQPATTARETPSVSTRTEFQMWGPGGLHTVVDVSSTPTLPPTLLSFFPLGSQYHGAPHMLESALPGSYIHPHPLYFFYFSYSGLEAKLEVLLTESARGETQKWPSAATERENRSQAEAKASHISPLRPRQGSSSPLPRLKGRGLCSRASSNSLSASNSMDQSPRGGPRPGLGGCPHR